MRYALVSDIHANLQAWKVVYEDIQNNNVDRIICLGDVIGYGPNPAEILNELRSSVDAFVLGNHDAAVCDKLDASLFNDDAKLLLDWTRKQLSEDDLKFLGSLPLTLIGDGFLCAHGEFAEPGSFDYVLEANEALPSWKANDSNLLIVGHTHEPALYVLGASGVPRTVEPQDFVVDPGKRYFVNIGSVGQPRGSDSRSCYCIYDTETKSIYWRRVAFDVEPYRKAMKATGLKLDPSYYLMPEETKPAAGTPVKRRIVFTPPKTTDKGAHNVVSVQDLKTIPPRKKKIPLNRISAAVVLTAILIIFAWKRTHPAMDFDATSDKVSVAVSKNVLGHVREVIEAGHAIPGWIVHIDNRYSQRAGVNMDPFGQPFYYLASKKHEGSMLLASPVVMAKPGQVWDVDAAFQIKKDFSGTVTLALASVQESKDKPAKTTDFFTRSPDTASSGNWIRIREKVTIPEGVTKIQFQIQGKLIGTVLIKNMNLSLVSEAAPEAPAATVPAAMEPAPAAPSSPADAPAASDVQAAPPASSPANDPWKTIVK